MPQAPTANMLIVWPSDLSDGDAWAPIMDTAVRVVIDQHNHAPGKGVLVPSAGLNINADIGFSTTGIAFSLFDVRAVDFKAGPPANVVAFAGALFVSDGTSGSTANELYWRTTGGTNVQLTAGASLNVAGFVGGIGGDYTAVGALVVFDDSTDSYWFQQQIGAAVRQYARMRCGDVDLYEYKAQPAAGPPVQRVRLASPAALAGSYTLTFPGALPATAQTVSIDNTGQIALGASQSLAVNNSLTLSGSGDLKHGLRTLQIHGTAFQPKTGTPTYAASVGTTGISVTGAALSVVAPILLRAGDRILAIRFYVADSATGPTKVQGAYGSSTSVFGTALLASTPVSAGTGANQTLSITGLTTTLAALTSYWIQLDTTTGTNLSACSMVEIDFDHP